MLKKAIPLLLLAVFAAACSSAPAVDEANQNPERAVVTWFDAIDGGDAASAASAVDQQSLALILGLENDLDHETIAEYLDSGVPLDLQAPYWSSFSSGFAEFSSRPVSTLTVGESTVFSAEGSEFASVPVAAGGGSESVVITRMDSNGSWHVDLVATLGDGFAQLLGTEFATLPNDASGDRIRLAYDEIVVPSLWAAMTDGSFGDDFTRSALALIEAVES